MKNILETERLLLREFSTEDASFIIELLNSPGWLKYIGDRNVKTLEQASEYLLNGPIKSYAVNGYGLWLVEKKDDQAKIGMCGIIRRETLKDPDIGFAFLPEFSGKGYAYEIAKACLDHAKNTLGIKTISAITVPYNESSIRLLEKLGLSMQRTIMLPGSTEELLLYEIINQD